MLITLSLGVAGYFTIAPLFSLLRATEDSLSLIAEYMQTLYLGMFALVGALTGNSALMTKGIVIRTTIIMGIGGIVKLEFTPFSPIPQTSLFSNQFQFNYNHLFKSVIYRNGCVYYGYNFIKPPKPL